MQLVSKVLPSNASIDGTIRSCEASLKRLQVETIDLYLLHWRGRYPLRDTVEAFQHLLEQGKIRCLGSLELRCRRYGGAVRTSPEATPAPPTRCSTTPNIAASNTICCHGAGSTKSPSWPIRRSGRAANSSIQRRSAASHESTSVSPAQVAIAWCLRQPVLAIPKAGSIEHVEENAAAEALDLDAQDLAEIDRSYPAPKRKQPLDML